MNTTSGHWPYAYTEAQKCPPLPGMEGGPNWCMTEVSPGRVRPAPPGTSRPGENVQRRC